MKNVSVKSSSIITVVGFSVVAILLTASVAFANSFSEREPIHIQSIPNETIAYAAAMSTLPENDGKNKEEMVVLAQDYSEEVTKLNQEYQDYVAANKSLLEPAYDECEKIVEEKGIAFYDLKPEDVPAKYRKIIESNTKEITAVDKKMAEINDTYKIDELPILFYSIDEILGGIEDSLLYKSKILEMVEFNGLETKEYTIDEFYTMYEKSCQAEKEIAEKLKNDPKGSVQNIV